MRGLHIPAGTARCRAVRFAQSRSAVFLTNWVKFKSGAPMSCAPTAGPSSGTSTLNRSSGKPAPTTSSPRSNAAVKPSPPLPEPPPYLPPAPGAQPQLGPFPVPAPVAQATPSLIGPTDPTGGLLTVPPVSTAPQGRQRSCPANPSPASKRQAPCACARPCTVPVESPRLHRAAVARRLAAL